MQGKTHQSAVVTIPPEEVWPPIQAIRQQHDSKVGRWMPHITVIYPFVPRAAFASAAERLAPFCRKVRTVDVELTRFETFNHGKGHYTVWLKPEPTKELADLHAAVWTAVSHEDDFEPSMWKYTPHLSVGQARGTAAMVELVSQLRASWTPVRFRVSEVSLIWRESRPDDVFRVVRTAPLGGS